MNRIKPDTRVRRLRRFRTTVLAVWMAGLCLWSVSAQEVEFEIQAPLTVANGQQFQIEYSASTTGDLNGAQFAPPTMPDGIEILSGPVRATGVFMSNMGGVSESRQTHTYTYWVRATRAGKITLPAATLTVGNKRYTAKSTVIESLDNGASGGGKPSGSGGAAGETTSSAPKTTVAADDVLLRMEVSKNDVYKGEALVATLRIYTQVEIAGLQQIKYPALNGFWAQEMDVSAQGGERVTVGGKVYLSQVLRRWLLYPQRTGTIEIEQTQLTAVARLVTQMPSTGSPYDLFFGGAAQVKEVPTRLSTPVVRIRVKELPQPQPSDFNGAVGQFQLTGVISGDRFPAHSAGSISLRLNGTGNFPLIEAPRIELPVAFEQFDTKMTERLVNTPRGTTGERTYEYPFIARAEGTYEIPAVGFSYFDPVAGRYDRLTTDAFHVEIVRGEGGSGSGLGMVSGVTKEDLKLLGSDIRFIRMGDPHLVRQGRAFLWSWGWFLAAIALALLFAGLLFYLQRRIRERADIVRVKTRKADKVALRRLKRAKAYLAAGKESPFFEEMLRALWGYMSDKLAISVADLTKDRVRHVLVVERGISDEEAREFLNLISECEFAQYAPAGGVQMDKAYQAALDWIGRFESKI
ncbi:BatD family protein [uncultured Rikenella sp.]|uniref:BatD family protein n=1 Tax=uncultured Rikenella sp. TaxID=368003 RepID=UPI0025E20520|nr:BatD family protein [uncultured Rikenella sp.]